MTESQASDPLDEIEALSETEPGDPLDSLTQAEQADLLAAESGVALISYSGQDFDVSGLVRRLKNEDILVPTFGHSDPRISSAGFQRSFVWTRPQMDRFIESLLLGYPVPGIFLVRQTDRRYLVLDGQQRLRTLQHFMDGVHEGRVFSLQNVAAQFKGLTYATLPEDLRRQVDDTFFQGTVVATDGSRESLEAVYQIFERVNAGGTQLTPHEIRVALYAGPFIGYLEQLNLTPAWRALYGKKSPRLRDQELILRVLAFLSTNVSEYKAPLKTFLNAFAAKHRQLDQGLDLADLEARFVQASELLAAADGRALLRPGGPQINVAMTEAVFVALMRRLLEHGPVQAKPLEQALRGLPEEKDFGEATARGTAHEENVRARLEIAGKAIAGV